MNQLIFPTLMAKTSLTMLTSITVFDWKERVYLQNNCMTGSLVLLLHTGKSCLLL